MTSAPAPAPATTAPASAPGAASRPPGEAALLIGIYSAAVLLSTVGNLTVMVVLTRGRQSRTDLRGFLLSLAVADLLIGCFCLPFTLVNTYLRHWPLPNALCKLVSYCQLVSVTSSVLTNMAIGFDRFWVVAFPLSQRLTFSRSRVVIGLLWAASLLLSSVQLVVSGKQPGGGNATELCREHWDSPIVRRAYSVLVLTLTYLLPVGVLCATYAVIGRKLWTRTLPGNADSTRDLQHVRAKRKIVKMLIVVVSLFALCWMPLHVYNVLLDYSQLEGWLDKVTNERLFIAFHWIAMANSFVNPIVYGFMNDSFKSDLSTLLRQLWQSLPCGDACSCLLAAAAAAAAAPARDELAVAASAAGFSLRRQQQQQQQQQQQSRPIRSNNSSRRCLEHPVTPTQSPLAATQASKGSYSCSRCCAGRGRAKKSGRCGGAAAIDGRRLVAERQQPAISCRVCVVSQFVTQL